MAVDKRLKIYNGTEPYVFISYSHKDYNLVSPILISLQKEGCRFWLDQKLIAGDEWSDSIAEHIENCSTLLFFVSKNSCASDYCRDELSSAKKNGKPMVLVYIEDGVEMPKGLDLITSRYQHIMNCDESEILEQLCESNVLTDCFETDSDIAVEEEVDCEIEEDQTEAEEELTEEELKANKSEKIKLIISYCFLGVAILLLLLAVLYRFVLKKPSGGSTAATYSAVMTDDWTDLTFTLDGKVYKLPCSLSVFLDRGWVIAEGYEESLLNSNIDVNDKNTSSVASVDTSSTKVSSRKTTNGKPLHADSYIIGKTKQENIQLKNGDKHILVNIYNSSGNTQYLKYCTVWGIRTGENADITLAKGLSQKSTVDQIIDALGIPTSRTDMDIGEVIGYENDKENMLLAFSVFKNKADKELNFITMQYGDYKNLDSETVTDENEPGFHKDYIEPTQLGEDITVPTVKVEGVVYTLPAPISEFEANSWSLFEAPPAIKSASGDIGSLKCGDKHLKNVYIMNASTRQHLPQHCTVASITCDTESNFELVLPGGITVGTDKATLDKAITEDFTVSEKDGKYVYKYGSDNVYSCKIEIKVDKETEKIDSIDVASYYWHYPKK